MIELPMGWVLGIIGALGGVVTTLAGLLWSTMKERLAAQDRIIERLQADVERMAKGCGHRECLWRER